MYVYLCACESPPLGSGLGFDPGFGRNFNNEFLSRTKRDRGTKPQSLVSVSNISCLYPKVFSNGYDTK